MIELVVFDMAGTTVDEDNVVYKTVRQAINAAGYNFTQEQVQSAGAGKEKSQAIRDVLALDGADHSEDEVQAIFADFRDRLVVAYNSLDVVEQPGASDIFRELHSRGIKVVLNTGYVTASDVETGRPAPDMIYLSMALTQVTNAASVAKIGDSRIDIEEGQNANCGMALGITTGAQPESELLQSNPTAVIYHLRDLLQLVDQTSNAAV